MFEKLGKLKPKRIIFAVIIALAVISFWRGIWGLMDLYIFPEKQTLSFTISIMIGLIILLFTNYLVRELI